MLGVASNVPAANSSGTDKGGSTALKDALNIGTTPTERGLVRSWVMLRDDRGGVGFRFYLVLVE